MAELVKLFDELSDADFRMLQKNARFRQFAYELCKTELFSGSGSGAITLPLSHDDPTKISNVSANDHHNQQHAIDGADHTGTLANDHAQIHTVDGADHTFPSAGGATWLDDDGNFTVPAVSGSGIGPCWYPPDIHYKDADEIYLGVGEYYQTKSRIFPSGHYENPSTSTAWTVASRTAVDLDAIYAAGATSGMIDAAKVVSSVYALYMTSTGIVLVLPYIRIDAISFGAGSTTINPASQADGTTAENGYFTANDAWNGYRLQKIAFEDAYAGTFYTIADCVNAVPDQILITGDVTAELAVTDWLQVCPPAATAHCYIGDVIFDAAGNLLPFGRRVWSTQYPAQIQIVGTHNTVEANTALIAAVPPTAININAQISAIESTNCKGIIVRWYSGSSGTNQIGSHRWTRDDNAANITCNSTVAKISLSAVASLRNMMVYVSSVGVETALTGTGVFGIIGYDQ